MSNEGFRHAENLVFELLRSNGLSQIHLFKELEIGAILENQQDRECHIRQSVVQGCDETRDINHTTIATTQLCHIGYPLPKKPFTN